MAEINLLKNSQQDRPKFSLEGSNPTGLYVALTILVLELLLYAGLFGYNLQVHRQIQAVQERGAQVDTKVSQNNNNRQQAVAAQARLANLQTLLNTHLGWSAVFGELENVTYKLANFTDLQVRETGNTLLISGNAPTYTDVAKVIIGLQTSSKILDVTLVTSGQSQITGSGYTFNLEVTFDPKLLLK
jgi:hypothetical protein